MAATETPSGTLTARRRSVELTTMPAQDETPSSSAPTSGRNAPVTGSVAVAPAPTVTATQAFVSRPTYAAAPRPVLGVAAEPDSPVKVPQNKSLASELVKLSMPALLKLGMALNWLQLVFAIGFCVLGVMDLVQENQAFGVMMSVSLFFGSLSGFYGIHTRDRGWLMLSFIVQMWLLSTSTPFFFSGYVDQNETVAACEAFMRLQIPSEDCDLLSMRRAQVALAALTLVLALMGSWVTLRLSEKLQEEAYITTEPQTVGRFSFDLPDMTIESMTKIIYGTCALELGLMVGTLTMAIVSPVEELQNFNIMFTLALFISICSGFYGANTGDRGWLMLSFIIQLWYLALAKNFLWLSVFNDAKDDVICLAKPNSPSCEDATTAAVNKVSITLSALSFFIALASAWLSLRLSEKLEDERDALSYNTRSNNDVQPFDSSLPEVDQSTPSFAGRLRGCFGKLKFDLPDQTLTSLTHFLYGFCGFLAVVSLCLIALGSVIEPWENKVFNLSLGVVTFVVILVGVAGGWRQDRSLLFAFFICQIWAIGTLTVFLYEYIVQRRGVQNACLVTKTDGCEFMGALYTAQVLLPSLSFVAFIAASWVSLRLSEKIVEEYYKLLRSNRRRRSLGC